MLNSLCFTPETCEVIHDCAGIMKSLCWYKTVTEGEKQSRNTRDVWWRSEVLTGEGVGPGAARAEERKENSALAVSPFHPFLPLSPPAWQGEEHSWWLQKSICRLITLLLRGQWPCLGGKGKKSLVWAVCLRISETPNVCRLCWCLAEGQTSSILLLSHFVLLELLCFFCCHSFLHCRELGMSLLNVLSTLNRALCSRVWNAHWGSKAFGVFCPHSFWAFSVHLSYLECHSAFSPLDFWLLCHVAHSLKLCGFVFFSCFPWGVSCQQDEVGREFVQAQQF